ncbi:hypothetical protein CDAR_270841 [Caerostris darwini]|uniref:Uncharacterized protein n=1 Tax=Caerostris darwini TaxID=1538125 RepID=A0AAV4TA93_9ARAC|nr:hypothetical protein CDAR_270841 [Caerostris darwini]
MGYKKMAGSEVCIRSATERPRFIELPKETKELEDVILDKPKVRTHFPRTSGSCPSDEIKVPNVKLQRDDVFAFDAIQGVGARGLLVPPSYVNAPLSGDSPKGPVKLIRRQPQKSESDIPEPTPNLSVDSRTEWRRSPINFHRTPLPHISSVCTDPMKKA